MDVLRVIFWGGCLVAILGCQADLNDDECDVDSDCRYKPGTICSPENWCVVPEPVRSDPPVTMDATVPDATASGDGAILPDATPRQDAEPPAQDQGAASDQGVAPLDGAVAVDALVGFDGATLADAALPIDGGPVSVDALVGMDGAVNPSLDADPPPLDAAPLPLDAAVDDGPTTADVFARMGPSCGPCHAPGAPENVAFFASEMNFQTQVVANPRFVSPGDPDGSLLVQLLEGTAEGGFSQMPLASSFVDLENAGETQITMAEIRLWISEL